MHDDRLEDFEGGEMTVPALLQLTFWLGLVAAAGTMALSWLTTGDPFFRAVIPLTALLAAVSTGAALALVGGLAARVRHPDEDHPVFR